MAYRYTNNEDISLALAVWLMHDDYDYDGRTNVISATSLIKPIRQLVLAYQNRDADKSIDISGLVSSRMGSAIHAVAEQAWTDPENVVNALKALNMSSIIPRVNINPEDGELKPDDIPVYVEQRHEKEVGDIIISGKYDLVLDGRLSDYKSTSVWTYIYDSNAAKYAQQGSIYRWLASDRITEDHMDIQYIFTDWSSANALRDSSYPQKRVMTKSYPLWSLEKTEEYIVNKLHTLKELADVPQDALPLCSSEDLWESETKYKYFKNPNGTRATKNFTTLEEANQRMADDGNVGVVKTVRGEAKACRYCDVIDICDQAKLLIADGRLTLQRRDMKFLLKLFSFLLPKPLPAPVVQKSKLVRAPNGNAKRKLHDVSRLTVKQLQHLLRVYEQQLFDIKTYADLADYANDKYNKTKNPSTYFKNLKKYKETLEI